MNKIKFLVVFLVLWAQSGFADNAKYTYPTAVLGEVGGRSLSYGLTFDRAISGQVAAGFGLGRASFLDGSVSTSVPVYMNFYLLDNSSSPFITGGVTYFMDKSSGTTSTGNVTLSGPMLPNFGVGFESRGDSGFLARFGGYGFVSGGEVKPWFGISIGVAF